MKDRSRFSTSAYAFAAASILAACGDGDGTSAVSVAEPPSVPPPPPASVSTVVRGTITGFGSVIVDGTRIGVDGATLYSVEDGAEVTGDQSGLRIGMQVIVRGETNSSDETTADRIEAEVQLRGLAIEPMVLGSDPATGLFTVAGQEVLVDADTVFDEGIGNNDGVEGIDVRDLDPAFLPGNTPLVVEVSGLPTDFGVVATRVERDDTLTAATLGLPGVEGDEVKVTGFVDAVATDGASVQINNGTFLIDTATELEDGLMIDASLIGQFVEIEADIDPAGNFIAVHVEAKEDLGGDNVGTRFLITGTLNAVDTAADPDTITINGLVLDVADASGLVDLVGRRVRLKGTFDETGLLVLDEADPEARNVIRIEDLVESVDQSAGALITRLGVPVTLADASRLQFIGEGAEDDDQQTPDDILARVEPGARLLARGVLEDDGSVIWTRILINDDDDEDCSLRAPVAANTVSDPVFDLLTVTVDTTSLADSEFEDDDDNEIGRTAFFAALEEGVLVKAESDEEGQGCTSGSLSTFNSGEVSLAGADDVFGNAPDGFVTGSQIEGDITAVDSDAMTFVLGERVLNVSRNTLIDSDLIEAARGEEIEEDFLPFGTLTESLGELLIVGDAVEVRVTANGLAALIEAAED